MPCFRHFLYTNFWTMVYFHVAFSEPGGEVALQHCTNCGSEIPDKARFCGKCGHEFSSVSTIDKETSIGVENEQQSEDVAQRVRKDLCIPKSLRMESKQRMWQN